MIPTKKEPLVWLAYEYVYREKSSDWYWAVTIIVISIAVTSVLFDNILFAIVIILGFFGLMMYAKRKPHIHQIKIDHRGIEEGRLHYLYSSLDSFWVEDRFGDFKIILKSKRKTLPYIVIPIIDVDPDVVRNYIGRYIKEEEHHEPIAKQIMEYLGF
ncbi:MAG: hypothetical protein EXS46_02840 [Candidatus Taylorbacteria bacterium]|nr:hypothetical protein [Candidatus Taylorbacteria bacterium]